MRNGIYYECDDCKSTAQFSSYNKARKIYGWAVAKDYGKCYCPKCAPAHRLGKAKEKNETLPKGWEQLGIEGI